MLHFSAKVYTLLVHSLTNAKNADALAQQSKVSGPAVPDGLDALRAVFTSSTNVKVRSHKLDRLVVDGLTAAKDGGDEDPPQAPRQSKTVAISPPFMVRLNMNLPDGASVRIRKEPHLESEAIGSLDCNSSIFVDGMVDTDWYRVDVNGRAGFVVRYAAGFDQELFQQLNAEAPTSPASPVLRKNEATRISSPAQPEPLPNSPIPIVASHVAAPQTLSAPLVATDPTTTADARVAVLEVRVAELERDLAALKALLRSA